MTGQQQPQIGRMRQLSVPEMRVLWPREEQDLSPWIRANVEHVNEATGLSIFLDEAEGNVGSYRFDLAGNEQLTQRPVIVENQFGKSDHDHLGKMLTYAADREAGVLIWIANEFTPPHLQALKWLNDITGDELSFYGLELEVFAIDDSRPAPRFALKAGPPRRKLPPALGELTDRARRYQAFWEAFLVAAKGHPDNLVSARGRTPSTSSWMSFGIGFSNFSLGASYTRDGRFRVELYIDTGIKETTKDAFAALKESQGTVEEVVGEPMAWDELPDRRASRIYIAREGTIDDSQELHREYIAWALERLGRIKKAFLPLLLDAQP